MGVNELRWRRTPYTLGAYETECRRFGVQKWWIGPDTAFALYHHGQKVSDFPSKHDAFAAASGMLTEGGDAKQAPFMSSPTGEAGDAQEVTP